ncbi:MAG TPA: hypothetical protein VFW04_13260 [Gemmatimonadaceae bacterium]|nr:hypothetical protein [Gemmatimonadaceae bacterium]
MLGWFRKKPASPAARSAPPAPPTAGHPLRELLFGDYPLEAWAPGGDAPRTGEPWTRFADALARRERGDVTGARNALAEIVRQPGLESRHRVQAWHALRDLGQDPPPTEAKHVYGVVVDMPTPAGLDTLAAYEDRSARFLSHGGGAVVWEHPDASLDAAVDALLAAGRALVGPIGPWAGVRPPLPPGEARISILTPSGLHFGQGPVGVFRGDARAAPVLAAATALMQALITKAVPR